MPKPIPLSFWEDQYLINYDALIVGGGIVGLSTALFLKRLRPKWKICILERGLLPTGASTRNAGFACMGSPGELLADLATLPEQEIANLFTMRYQGLQLLEKTIGSNGFERPGSYEAITVENEQLLNEVDRLNAILKDCVPDQRAFAISTTTPASLGLGSAIKQLIECRHEGAINTGIAMATLLELVTTAGVEIKTGCEVLDYLEHSIGVTLSVSCPVRGALELKAAQWVVCTNAFTPKLFPEIDVIPGRGQVLVTAPVDGLRLKGTFHMNDGYFYFRNIGNRVLIGGGRNLDLKTERTTAFESNTTIIAHIEEMLKNLVIPHHAYTIEYTWSGIMAFGNERKPIIRRQTCARTVAVRMGGMGVAIGCEMGRQAASLAIG